MGRGFGIFGALSLFQILAVQALAAPPLPDAGQLLQQIERGREPGLPQREAPELVRPAEPVPQGHGPTVVVKAFRFVGNTRIASDQLTAAVSTYVDRPLDLAGLQLAAAAVAEVYRKAGWIVRAFLPEQDIVGGVVTIQIVEAVYGGTDIEGPPPARIDAARLQATIDQQLPKGAPVSTDRLDRGLLLLGDLPGLAVQGTLRPGTAEGETRLVVRTTDRPLFNANVGIDDFGDHSTGAIRGTGDFFANSPLHLGDQIAVSFIGSAGNNYGRAGWSIPVGYDGWRVGASASYLQYNLISDQFKALDASGTSSTEGVFATWPVIRARMANLYLGLNYDHRNFDNLVGQLTVSNYRIDAFSAGLTGNLFDHLAGPGVTTAGVTLTQGLVGPGHPDFGDAAPADKVAFTKLRYFLSRQQSITGPLSAYGAASGQWTGRNLDSSEKFYLGGPAGVRAYPVDEAGGSLGEMINLELRWQWLPNLTTAAFYDWGHVDVSHDHGFLTQPNSFSLQGAGLSLAWQTDFGLLIKAMWAHRIGGNPNAAANGADQDGTHFLNRIWLSATQPF